MTVRLSKALGRPRITLSYWLALSSALISFAIVSDQLLFALIIGTSAIGLKCISPSAPKSLRYSAQLAFTLTTYLYALLPLWPNSYSDYFYSPIFSVVAVALIAALNRHSYGGSRGVTSIAAIAFLLLIRNIVLYFEFKAPIDELSLGLAFVGLMEIALSPRFTKSQDNPHPELVFGLIVALVASFNFTSLPLGLVLASLPVISFLVRNHELAKIANEHTQAATLISPSPRRIGKSKTTAVLAIVPLVAASLLYLTALQIPFWGNLLPHDAPYLAKSIAQKAATISEAADLEDEAISEVTSKVVDPEFIRDKATQLTQSWKREKQEPAAVESAREPSLSSNSQRRANPNPNTRPYDSNNFEYRLGPFARDRASAPPADTFNRNDSDGVGSELPQISESRWNNEARQTTDLSNPPTPKGLTQGIPDGIDTDFSSFSDSPQSDFAATPSATSHGAGSIDDPEDSFVPEQNSPTPDFDNFLDAFEQPERAISQALNLEGSDVSALLSEEALAIVKLDSNRSAPRRLYLRSNVLDTVDRYGMGGTRGTEGRVELPVADDKILTLRTFRQSKSEGRDITITSNQSRSPTLPLPESFSRIQIFNTETLKVYPEERVAHTPRSLEPITYRLYEADLEITDRERKGNAPSDDYRDRMLEVPLNRQDRNYLEKLAKRVGGSRSPTRQFAYRFANYFANRHPYSYFVTIPPGSGHSVVRWLENESPGLCSNYAAAFTLLARSRGIPARVVGGFASNEFDNKEGRFIMRQRNAHAWVEYMDESNNWVRFDPTPGISEAEILRAEQYVTSGNSRSLQRLIASEATATQEDPALAKEAQTSDARDRDQIVDSIPTEAESVLTEKLSESSPTSERAETYPQNSVSPSTTPKPQKNAVSTSTASGEPQQIPSTEKSAEPVPLEPLETAKPAQANPAVPSETNRQNPPWLVLLAILAILIPGIAYLMRFKKTNPESPELQLRQQAGRLLAELDKLLQQHELTQDPIWIETRQTLTEQRYGRETNPILVQDLAIKVGLLSKRKKS
ncbi:transglutaminase domain-containing protein [Pelagicoccus sp. SDUM812002]|uniref:transglutaminase-like domain-containing protein n=1 Tax=Pelagicoccus sp. SDUM812002 TaxID=3041266 RepID=UPI00280F87B0|nr:transglutaminase domain-containing protein [Pelagicoccus sp. SDUM812002]MDQ8187018.1 transglutaminase domain-containing protein [Pelagicoccus sp. SDUM812002]